MAEPEAAAAALEADKDASPAIWLGLIFVAAVSFWSQATVTEER